MEKIPLQVRLKRESHRKIAYAQDIILKEVYALFNRAVLHGGTAIWRCYSGKRFSEDLDFYLPNDKKNISILFENIKNAGFEIKKQKVSETSIYSELELNRVSVRLEATFQKKDAIICDYELSDGNIVSVYSLTPDMFLIEKINTYLKRFRIRDLWDIFFLLRNASASSEINEIGKLIKNYKKPVDEADLKVIILEGVIPSSEEMMGYVKRKWEHKHI